MTKWRHNGCCAAVRRGTTHWRARFRSLHFKASLFVVLVVVTATTVGVAISARTMSLVLYENEYARSLEWANSLAAGTAEAVESADRTALARMVGDLVRTRAVTYAIFADVSGEGLARAESIPGLPSRCLLANGRLNLEPMHNPELVWYRDLQVACAEVVVPVYSARPLRPTGQTSRPIVGYLRLATDITRTKAQIERVQRQVSRIGIVLALLVVPCSLIVTRYVVSPLNELARTARAIANGSTDARARVHADNEIGDLAESFNTMADRLTSSQLELLELNAELEQRVAERTRELQELAARDPLTGLYNRRHFSEVISREFAGAERYDADLTCLMLDLDRFKEINDRFGHAAGDDVLTGLADAIATELRGSDVAARFGGDEFVVLLPQTSLASASMLVDRIIQRFGEQVARRRPDIPAGVSVGAASLRTCRPASAEALMHEADVALYAAKEASRSRRSGGQQAAQAATITA